MRPLKPISFLMLVALVALHTTVALAENGQGTISGTVRLVGTAPRISSVLPRMDFDMCGTVARPTQSLLLGTNQTVRNAIVYLAGYAQSNPSLGTNDTIVLDQRDC